MKINLEGDKYMSNFIIRNGSDDENNFVFNKLVEYNLSQVPLQQEIDYIYINRVIENENKEIIAGISGKIYCWNCVYVDQLWVDEKYRKEGLGRSLLEDIENLSKEKGCHLIHLDTFDFQAKDFYLRNGYEVFGVLEDCPKEHKRYYLKKNI